MGSFIPTAAHVREIISTSLSDEQIMGVMASSVTLVVSRLGHRGLDSGLIIELERWVCAHDISTIDGSSSVSEEQLGDAKVKYSETASSSGGGRSRMGLLMTSWWGIRACAMDPTGTLANLGGQPPALFAVSVPVLSS